MDAKLRIIVIAAHPDEADMYAGGTAALFAKHGHEVKLVSLTCGDAGHHEMSRLELAGRRYAESQEAARRLGVREYQVFDTHDSELMPTLETRHRIMKVVRDWQADIVISLNPRGGGHPDNRAVGIATEEAYTFLSNRNAMPDAPPLPRPPVLLYMIDYITLRSHRHDLVIDVDPVMEEKLRACDANASQFYEYSARQYCDLDEVPTDWPGRREFILRNWAGTLEVLPEMKPALVARYGEAHASQVKYAETFEFAPDSRIPDEEELRAIFPMLPGALPPA
jgi:LmbE family N-acetylglucosaminyl deacetylase